MDWTFLYRTHRSFIVHICGVYSSNTRTSSISAFEFFCICRLRFHLFVLETFPLSLMWCGENSLVRLATRSSEEGMFPRKGRWEGTHLELFGDQQATTMAWRFPLVRWTGLRLSSKMVDVLQPPSNFINHVFEIWLRGSAQALSCESVEAIVSPELMMCPRFSQLLAMESISRVSWASRAATIRLRKSTFISSTSEIIPF